MFVRTVLGDIDARQLGVCYAHEHVIIDRSFTTHVEPELCLDSVDLACEELTAFYQAGGRAMIDTMPCHSGRNVRKLAEVSRRTGVHIVCPTGLHLQKYYPPGHWSLTLDADELAELFIADIELGVDANDYGGPQVRRTGHKAGVIKVAGGRDHLSEQEQKTFKAAATAHLQTGCPIITHTQEGTAALEQIDILGKAGVELEHVVLSHTDRLPNIDLHRSLLRTGVRLEYDGAFRWQPPGPNHTLELVAALLPEFPNQLMLGMDAARRQYWRSYGGAPGLTYLLEDFSGQLRGAGLDDGMIDRLFVHNPAELFRFVAVSQPQTLQRRAELS